MTDPVSGNGHRPHLPRPGTGRRRSLIILVGLLVVLPASFFIREATDEGWRLVTTAKVLEERDVIYLPDARVFLVDGDPPIALSAASPHLGEPLAYCASSETFVSLAHGELFDRAGRYIGGPAPRGMDRIGLRVRQGIVEINIERRTPGLPRSSRGLAPGPTCDLEGAEVVRGFLDPSPSP